MISCHSGSALTVFSVNAGYWFTCSLGGFAASFLIPMRNVVVTAQALGILILHEKRLLTSGLPRSRSAENVQLRVEPNPLIAFQMGDLYHEAHSSSRSRGSRM